MAAGVKVAVPATVANLSVGFDALGLALDHPGDELIAIKTPHAGRVEILEITGARNLPKDPTKNTAGQAALSMLTGVEADFGVQIKLRKKLPIGSGLGSSAASAVASVVAINSFLHHPLEKQELLAYAVEGEAVASGAKHADNVAPALYGGIMLIRDNKTLDVHRLLHPSTLYVTIISPDISVLTMESRKVLPTEVPFNIANQQAANFAGLVTGLFYTDWGLIQRSMEDLIVEPARAALIPKFYDIKAGAMEAGVLGCSISGAGPAIFALSNSAVKADNALRQMKAIYTKSSIKHFGFVSKISKEGAIIM